MVESERVSTALHCVKPLCMKLVHCPCSACLQDITRHVQGFDQEIMQQLQQFLIFPLRTTLMACISKSLPQQVLIETCQAVDMVLCKSKLQHMPMFMDLFSLLSDLMLSSSDTTAVPGKRKLSEEEKTAAIQSLCCLVNSCQQEVLHELYLPTSIAQLGGVVSQLVAVVSDVHTSRSLRSHALSALLVLMQKRTFKHNESWWQHGNRFAGLLPGISTAMVKVLLGDGKQGHLVFCRALEVWTEVVCLTLGDQSLALERKQGYGWIDDLKMEGRLKELIGRRDEGWVKGVVPRVEFMVKEVIKLKKHDHWKVRRQLVRLADQLLSHCGKSLQSCTSPLLEVLVLLMTDAYTQVSAPASAALENFRRLQAGSSGGCQLIEILKDDLFSLLTSLPRRIKMEDEEEKQAVVGLLLSYITLIGQDISSLLMSHNHVSRLTRVLVQVLEMDVSDQKILEESGMGALGSAKLTQFVQQASVMVPRKVFVHFRDDKVKTDLFQVCRLLGQYGELSVVVESVMEMYRESAAHHLPCVLMLTEVMTGLGKTGRPGNHDVQSDPETLEDIVRLLLEEYLSHTNMSLTDNVDASNSSPQPWSSSSSLLSPSSSSSLSLFVMDSGERGTGRATASRNRAIMLTCLFLEGVAACAKVLGRRFCVLLTEVLYPVAEKVGSKISAISGTAFLTLSQLTDACGFRSVDELLQSNADYIVTSISLRLWHFEHHPRAPSVLSVMLQLCNTDILPLVWDSVLQILDTLDEHHADQAVVFLPVLHQLTLAVARWFPPQKQTVGVPRKKPSSTLEPQELVQFLLDRQRTMAEAENFEAEPEPEDAKNIQEYMTKMAEENKLREEEEEEETEETKEDENREPPLHVTAVKEVLLRAKHIVSSSDPRLTLLALDVISQGCADLVDYENELLPIVHQLWPAFKQRFQDSEKIVVIKAVKSLHRLCNCCGDFIRQRVEKEVLPSFKSFLHSQAQSSKGKGASYQYTVNYKLQLTLLTTLGDMALKMGLDGLALEPVVHCCLPYLSQCQPAKLQEACVESMKKMMQSDGDVVWFALCELYVPSLPTPPAPLCQPITAFKNVGETNEYSSNVVHLLQHLDKL